ncbi:DNA-processing protein DprA [Acutalibacter caecimuris]|uniref:DNA-processing protein DprA n=1 Tax=Acutalibacter caecimuris TaxID=3093657 RepID=UPI002AC91B33|nr:DNA-processing protein DprA [Acutalibacter sp. M00118]
MSGPHIYWIWCQEAFGPGSPLPLYIHENFPGGVPGFAQAGPVAWRSLPYLSPRHVQALRRFTLSQAQSRLQQALSFGWQVLVPESPGYPPALRHTANPPAVLYVQGCWPAFSAPAVAVAGARKPLPASQKAACKISYQLAAGGATLVSGSAAGVDACALAAALRAGGQVVSVLPVDLHSPYPTATRPLRRRIISRGGALVTEHFSQRAPVPGAFHWRNRIVTGLSQAVVLVQADIHSGTMIYATCAADQGRDVYVYPGPAGSPAFAGSRLLLEDGARPAETGLAVLRDLPAYCRGGSHTRYLYPLPGRSP